MAKYNPRRSGPEWLRLITECRQSGMPACAIPEAAALSGSTYALDLTAHQDVVRVNIGPGPEAATAHTDMPLAGHYRWPRDRSGVRRLLIPLKSINTFCRKHLLNRRIFL